MKIITFFSPKGGSGKTTFNLLFASYLKYILNKQVLLLDFDAPNFNACLIREKELENASHTEELYQIQKVDNQTNEKILAIVKNLAAIKDSVDYVVVDFRGSFSADDALIIFAKYGILDKVIIPIEMDNQLLSSANSLASVFASTHQDVLLFFNKVYPQENMALYNEVRDMFARNGHVVSENVVYNTVKLRRDIGKSDNLRSSIIFPSKEKLGRNIGIINLFNEILDENKR